ncbi:pathogenesis-related protein 1B-like [Arachis stenosperma]|uniref:pathogenesis-related protein 1B-like n=1 Tax=Arachis stenosperma TaxID=217475 RepID=UPI0025AC3154|nr:pathogenesis-related protein 1B-like [Arachis stenosperma]
MASLFSVVLCVLGLVIVGHVAYAQDSRQDYLDAHNAARSEVGVPNLSWDDTVAAYAQNYANQRKGDCQLVHSDGQYGENIAGGSGDFSGTVAVKLWVDEKQYYDYNSNSCASGQVCGHYTQVIWRDSIRLGCAKVTCDNNAGTFIICSYDPPGNIIGQKPY